MTNPDMPDSRVSAHPQGESLRDSAPGLEEAIEANKQRLVDRFGDYLKIENLWDGEEAIEAAYPIIERAVREKIERRYSRDTPGGLEQARRNFMADYGELYDYLLRLGIARELKHLGDHFSSKHDVANYLWGQASDFREGARIIRGGSDAT